MRFMACSFARRSSTNLTSASKRSECSCTTSASSIGGQVCLTGRDVGVLFVHRDFNARRGGGRRAGSVRGVAGAAGRTGMSNVWARDDEKESATWPFLLLQPTSAANPQWARLPCCLQPTPLHRVTWDPQLAPSPIFVRPPIFLFTGVTLCEPPRLGAARHTRGKYHRNRRNVHALRCTL